MNWLKRKLRQWLDLEDPRRVDSLECWIEGKLKRVSVGEPVGLRLMVYCPEGTFLIGESQCINKRDFWKAWSQKTKPITFEDGTPFQPEKMI